MRKYIIVISLILLSNAVAWTQQESLTTQFAYNKLLFNPAFAGVENRYTATLNIRDQWNGLEGAPSYQSINLDFPLLAQNIGLGLQLKNFSIGIQKMQSIGLSYAYLIKLNNSILHIGMNASYSNQINDFTDDRLFAIDGFDIDPSIQRIKEQLSIFNIGFGLNYRINGYYFALGVPQFLNQSRSELASLSKTQRTVYLMMGKENVIGPKIKIFPELKLGWTKNVPMEIDLQFRMLLSDLYLMGINYRSQGGTAIGESIGLIGGLNVSQSVLVGIAYDINVAEFRATNNGSIELFLRYRFGTEHAHNRFINPRYF